MKRFLPSLRRLFGPKLRNRPGLALVVKCNNRVLMRYLGRPLVLTRFRRDDDRWETNLIVDGFFVIGTDECFAPITPPAGTVSDSEVTELFKSDTAPMVTKEAAA